VHQVISRIESEMDQIRSMCQQLEQAERSNQQLAQQLQSSVMDPNLRTQLQNMAQKEAFNAQKLQQISQIASQARQEVSQLKQQAYSVHQPQFQQQPVAQTGFQASSPQPISTRFQQPAGFQPQSRQQPSSTQQWVQRHAQTGMSPNQAMSILQQGVPKQQATQPMQTVPPVQPMSQPQPAQQFGSQYRSMNPYYQH
jgi:hypothetical protein